MSSPFEAEILRYLMGELKPQTRLDYFLLSNAERNLLRAMCAYSTEGAACDKPLPELARRAGYSRKQVQRLINGYKREGREVMGLKAKGILSELAPPNEAQERPATYRINWMVLSLDPRKVHILERRMQQAIPGSKRPTVPEEEVQTSAEDPAVKIPVEILGPYGHRVQRPTDTVSRGLQTPCPPPTDTVSVDKQVLSGNSSVQNRQSFSAAAQPSVEKTAWQSLPRFLWRKLDAALRQIDEAQAGMNRYGWTPEQLAECERERIVRASEMAGIWPNTAKKLADEMYATVLEDELSKARNS